MRAKRIRGYARFVRGMVVKATPNAIVQENVKVRSGRHLDPASLGRGCDASAMATRRRWRLTVCMTAYEPSRERRERRHGRATMAEAAYDS